MSDPELQLQRHLRITEQVGDTWEGPDDHNRLNSMHECVVMPGFWLQRPMTLTGAGASLGAQPALAWSVEQLCILARPAGHSSATGSTMVLCAGDGGSVDTFHRIPTSRQKTVRSLTVQTLNRAEKGLERWLRG